MPWNSLSQVPPGLKGAGLTLAQANMWARYYDESIKAGKNKDQSAGLAWTRFKAVFRKISTGWVRKER